MGLITVRNLTRTGRAGNQLFLYAFARAYAAHHGCELQIPADWWGRKVFTNVQEKEISHHLPQTPLDSRPGSVIGEWFGQTDIDIFSYCQHQRYLDFYTRAWVRDWFTIKDEYLAFACGMEQSYTALHVRHGDYLSNPLFRQRYCSINLQCYYRALKEYDIHPPIYVVQDGGRRPAAELEDQGLEWLQDWMSLIHAACLFRANSSFSVWAGWLSQGRVFSPVIGDRVGLCDDVKFVEGNHENTAPFFPNQSSLYLKEA